MLNKTQVGSRSGFTLVELLVVISILGFMSGMFIVAYRGANAESNLQKTRATIQKISEVINARMDEYQNQQIPIRVITGGNLPSTAVSTDATETSMDRRERARLLLLRDMIRMEMPDHPDDLKFTPFWQGSKSALQFKEFLDPTVPSAVVSGLPRAIPSGLAAVGGVSGSPGFVLRNPIPGRARSIMTRLSEPGSPGLPRSTPEPWDKHNANAELLFLIVEGSELNGTTAIELFGKSEIGDTDNDGLNEFIDAFGRPIRWIRWPAGFAGATRFHPDMLNPNHVDSTGRLKIDSDPIDRFGTDPGWRKDIPGSVGKLLPGVGLTPLVISAGADGVFGVRFREFDRYGGGTAPLTHGDFSGNSSYSSSDFPWVPTSMSVGTPFPTYGDGFRFTDPWYPRVGTVYGLRMGERLPSSGSPADFENETAAFGFHADDNISNYDGNGVSL